MYIYIILYPRPSPYPYDIPMKSHLGTTSKVEAVELQAQSLLPWIQSSLQPWVESATVEDPGVVTGTRRPKHGGHAEIMEVNLQGGAPQL